MIIIVRSVKLIRLSLLRSSLLHKVWAGVVLGEGSKGTIPKGFVYSNGKYTEIFPPWSNYTTYVTSINNSGVVVGWGTDNESAEKGFIALPKF